MRNKNKIQINIVHPILPNLSEISIPLKEILKNGKLTNNSKYVVEFEKRLCDYLNVNYCVAVGNATLGLILALRALNLKEKSHVIAPSFTFSATIHSIIWAGLTPVFADITADTFTMDIKDVERKITSNVKAILAVNTYGNSCEIEKLESLAEKYKLKLIFDSAHAFGCRYKNKMAGNFGDAEVFSFHATKILPVGEGGVVATNNAEFAKKNSLLRVFGDTEGKDCVLPGINAKMQEFSAILGLKALTKMDYFIKNRCLAFDALKKQLSKFNGISFQKINEGTVLNYQYFPILIDEKKFGFTRDEVFDYLIKENIISRKYFYPPAHKFTCYKYIKSKNLENTDYISERILCLPIYSEMKKWEIDRIIHSFEKLKRGAV